MAYVTKDGESTVDTFMGELLDPPLKYEYKFDVFEGPGAVDEAKSAGKWLSDSQILERINQDSERNAKSKAYQEVLKDKRKAYEETDDFAFKELYSTIYARLVKKGMSPTEAKAEAETRAKAAM